MCADKTFKEKPWSEVLETANSKTAQIEPSEKDVIVYVLRGIEDDEAGKTVDAVELIEELRKELKK